jgi:hypothetical protein
MTLTSNPIKASQINPELYAGASDLLSVNANVARVYAKKQPAGSIIKYSDFLNMNGFKCSFGGEWTWSMTSYDNTDASGWRHVYPNDYFPGIAAGDYFTVIGGMNNGWTTDHIAAYTFVYGTDYGAGSSRQPVSIEFYMGPGGGGKNHEMDFWYNGGDRVQVSGHYGYGGSSTSWGIAQLYILGIWYGPAAGAVNTQLRSTADGTDLTARDFQNIGTSIGAWVNNHPATCAVVDRYVAPPPPTPGPDGGTSYPSCFLAGSLVVMADGSVKHIEDIGLGEWVQGAFGQVNQVIALDRPLLGERIIYMINDEHNTTHTHAHVRPDGTFAVLDVPAWISLENNQAQPVKTNYGTENWILPGLAPQDLELITELSEGQALLTTTGSRTVNKISGHAYPEETPLYNLVLTGNHTYFVDGYCVTGFLNGIDYDYRTWTVKNTAWTETDYRNNGL